MQVSCIRFYPRINIRPTRQNFTPPTSTSCWESFTPSVETSENCVTWLEISPNLPESLVIVWISLTTPFPPPPLVSRLHSTFQSSASRCWKEEVNYKTGAFVHLTTDQILKLPPFLWEDLSNEFRKIKAKSFETALTCPHTHCHSCCFMI